MERGPGVPWSRHPDTIQINGLNGYALPYAGNPYAENNDVAAIPFTQAVASALQIDEPRGIYCGRPDGVAKAQLSNAHGVRDGVVHAQRGARQSLLARQNDAAVRCEIDIEFTQTIKSGRPPGGGCGVSHEHGSRGAFGAQSHAEERFIQM